MTSAHEPHGVSRIGGRRPRRWESAGAIAGIIAAVLFVVDLTTLSASPSIGSTARDVVDHLAANVALTLVASYLGAVSAVLLLPFMASLRTFLRGDEDEAEWRWTITVLSGAVAVALVLSGNATRAGAAVLADHAADPAAVRALFAASKVLLTFSLIPLAVVVMASARTMSASPTPVRWLVRLGIEIGVLSLLSTAGLFFEDNDWVGPGEPVVATAAFLLSLWVVVTAVTILRGEAAAAAQ